jgi:hypothetical protein
MGLFFKDDPAPVETKAPVPPPAPVQIGAYDPSKGTFGTPAPVQTVIVTQPEDAFSEAKVTDKLRAALQQSSKGIDFYTFWQSLGALQNVIADEPTRYRAAIGTLAAQGATAATILSTASQFLQVLASKQSSFEDFLKERHRAEVEAKHNEADLTKEQIQAKADQINKLTQDIQELQTKELAARNAATAAEALLNANLNTFTTVKGRLEAEINMVHDRLQTYSGAQEPK